MILSNILFITSAIFYVLAFKFYNLGLFFILFSFILFFYSAFTSKISFISSFIWGLIAYGIFAYAIFCSISLIANKLVSFFCASFLLIYISIYPAYWFWVISKITYNNNYSLIIWIISLASYFEFINYGAFWLFGNLEGFGCLYPLIPAASSSLFCYFLSILGKELALALVLVFSGTVSLVLLNFRISQVITILSLISLFLLISLMQSYNYNIYNNIYNKYTNRFRKLALDFKPGELAYLWDRANVIADKINDIQENSKVEFILLPESAFPFELNKYPEVIDFWSRLLKEKTYLIVGSHRASSQVGVYNTLYLINNTGIVNYYDKCHRVFFTERVPSFFKLIIKYINNLTNFNYNCEDCFICGTDKNKTWLINNKLNICPIICSELFFLSKINLKSNNNNNLYLVAVNDLWFKDTFLPKILKLFAKFISYEKNIELIYAGYL